MKKKIIPLTFQAPPAASAPTAIAASVAAIAAVVAAADATAMVVDAAADGVGTGV